MSRSLSSGLVIASENNGASILLSHKHNIDEKNEKANFDGERLKTMVNN